MRLILINKFNYTSSGCFAATFPSPGRASLAGTASNHYVVRYVVTPSGIRYIPSRGRLKPKNIYVNEYKKHKIKRHRRNADAFSQSIYSFLVVSKFIYHLNYLIRLEGFSHKLRSAKLDGIYHFILLTCGRNHDHLCFSIYFTDAL